MIIRSRLSERWDLYHIIMPRGLGTELQCRASGSPPQIWDSGVISWSAPTCLEAPWPCLKLDEALPREWLLVVSILNMGWIFNPGFSLRSLSGGRENVAGGYGDYARADNIIRQSVEFDSLEHTSSKWISSILGLRNRSD